MMAHPAERNGLNPSNALPNAIKLTLVQKKKWSFETVTLRRTVGRDSHFLRKSGANICVRAWSLATTHQRFGQ